MKDHYLLSQPHQPFFLLAFINAIVVMVLFLLNFKGIFSLEISPASMHAYGTTFLLFTPAFFGFLFTTFPRFLSTDTIEKPYYSRVFMLYLAGSLLFYLGLFLSFSLSAIGMIFLFVGHALAVKKLYTIYKSSGTEDKHDGFWILTGMLFGLLSHFLFIFSAFVSLFNIAPIIGFMSKSVAIETSIYLYLFLTTFSVAQRMVPFFSHCMVTRDAGFMKKVALLLGLHVILEIVSPNLSFFSDLILAYITGKTILNWNLPFPNPNPLLWILHVALFWVPVAFLFGALSKIALFMGNFPQADAPSTFLFLDIHVLMLGFVFTILIGFGTRVTIGHSGNIMQAGMWEKILFNLTQLVVVLRLLVSVAAAYGWNFMVLFDVSATVWIVMFVLWGVRFFKVLLYGKKLTE